MTMLITSSLSTIWPIPSPTPTCYVNGRSGEQTTQAECTEDGGVWRSISATCYVNGVAGSQADQTACTAAQGTWLTQSCTHDLTTKVQVTNPVTTTAGTYIVRYLVSDWQGNYAEAYSLVTVSGN